MTQSEFIKIYCENSKMTEEELNKGKMFAVPCDCSEENCKGWAMTTKEVLRSHCEFYIHY